MKILARVVAVMSATALLAGCGPASLGSGKSPETKVVVVTQEADATGNSATVEDEFSNLREVDPGQFPGGSFMYENGTRSKKCFFYAGSVMCAGTPPSGTKDIPDRGGMGSVGGVKLDQNGVEWIVAEMVGAPMGPLIQVGTKITREGLTCGKPNVSALICKGENGSFKIEGDYIQPIELEQKENLSANGTLQEVDPNKFMGRQGVRVFDFKNGGSATGYCIFKERDVWCMGKSVSAGNANEVHVDSQQIDYRISEGPLEGKLNELKVGEKFKFSAVECKKPTAEEVVCSVGDKAVTITGPDYLAIEGDATSEGSSKPAGNPSVSAGNTTSLNKLKDVSPVTKSNVSSYFKFSTGGNEQACVFGTDISVACTGKTPQGLDKIVDQPGSHVYPSSIGFSKGNLNWGTTSGIATPENISLKLLEGQKISRGSNTCGMIDASTLHCNTPRGNFWIKGPESEITTDMDPKN